MGDRRDHPRRPGDDHGVRAGDGVVFLTVNLIVDVVYAHLDRRVVLGE